MFPGIHLHRDLCNWSKFSLCYARWIYCQMLNTESGLREATQCWVLSLLDALSGLGSLALLPGGPEFES